MSKEEFKNISHFKKFSDENRGTNEKEWLLSPDDSLCLYKITQIKEDNTSTLAHYSESIYSNICELLNVDCCKVELVQFQKRKGIISYYFLNDNEELIDFNALIQNIRQDYIPKSLKCKKTKEYYSIDLILEAISAVVTDREQYKQITKRFFELMIVDALCDHYDRNSSNISLIINYKNPHYPSFRFAPIYDNGTSLGVCLPVEVAKEYLTVSNGIDVLDNRITSKIGTGENRGASYKEVIDYLLNNYFEEIEEIIENLNVKINEQQLTTLLFQPKYKHLDLTYKKLIFIKLLYNKNRIINLYNEYKNTYQKTKK